MKSYGPQPEDHNLVVPSVYVKFRMVHKIVITNGLQKDAIGKHSVGSGP